MDEDDLYADLGLPQDAPSAAAPASFAPRPAAASGSAPAVSSAPAIPLRPERPADDTFHYPLVRAEMSSVNPMTQSGLYIGNLAWWTTDQDLADFFSPLGELNCVRTIFDQGNGKSLGYAYVEYTRSEDCQTALQTLASGTIKGRQVILAPSNFGNLTRTHSQFKPLPPPRKSMRPNGDGLDYELNQFPNAPPQPVASVPPMPMGGGSMMRGPQMMPMPAMGMGVGMTMPMMPMPGMMGPGGMAGGMVGGMMPTAMPMPATGGRIAPSGTAAARGVRPRDIRDVRDVRDIRDVRDVRDVRDIRDVRDVRDVRDTRDHRDNRDNRDSKDARDVRDVRDTRDTRDTRSARDAADAQETRDVRDVRDGRDIKTSGGLTIVLKSDAGAGDKREVVRERRRSRSRSTRGSRSRSRSRDRSERAEKKPSSRHGSRHSKDRSQVDASNAPKIADPEERWRP